MSLSWRLGMPIQSRRRALDAPFALLACSIRSTSPGKKKPCCCRDSSFHLSSFSGWDLWTDGRGLSVAISRARAPIIGGARGEGRRTKEGEQICALFGSEETNCPFFFQGVSRSPLLPAHPLVQHLLLLCAGSGGHKVNYRPPPARVCLPPLSLVRFSRLSVDSSVLKHDFSRAVLACCSAEEAATLAGQLAGHDMTSATERERARASGGTTRSSSQRAVAENQRGG